ncbi:MAG TPA: YicC family protein [Candidatus Fimenecus stercoravium]|nr:YicC family protein [Candidatus Fimenecus stercoravium]
MIKSMTGFGRAQSTVDGMTVTVELKSVNHRYFEFSARVPRNYGFLEEKLKSFVNATVARGKTECYVSIENPENDEVEVTVNTALARGYAAAIRSLSDLVGTNEQPTAAQLSRFPDVLTVHKAEPDEERVWNAVQQTAQLALEQFIAMRQTEGEKLRADILSHADRIAQLVAFVESRSPQTVREYNEKLHRRMAELLGDANVDEQRLLTEAAIFADKVAVDEETVRLHSHLSQLHDFLGADEPIGRKLDFLVQEINRESNTIGSKAQDVEIAKAVIDIKAEVEKIREQVQNIE